LADYFFSIVEITHCVVVFKTKSVNKGLN